MYLETMLEELQFLEEEEAEKVDLEELLMPLKHILTILEGDTEM